MLKSMLGTTRIEKLYLQILFRCNFRCRHCFHGVNLERKDLISAGNAHLLLSHFYNEYGCKSVCILGGEPLIHPELITILAAAKYIGYTTEICTNGYKASRILERCLGILDYLRVSLDGLADPHDSLRMPGSFDSALETLRCAAVHGIRTGVTCTLTGTNVRSIPTLYRQLQAIHVSEIVLHRLRTIGNAERFRIPDITRVEAEWLISELQGDGVPVLKMDTDILQEAGCGIPQSHPPTFELDRVEIAPDGRLYLSCKAVGSKRNAFRYDFRGQRVVYDPEPDDEVSRPVPQVIYA